MKKLILIFSLCVYAIGAFAQGNLDETLAAEYYRQGEYDKAAVVYKRLFDNNPNNTFYYESWFNSMIGIKNYKDLEKELKKISKKSTTADYYLIDLGYTLSLDGMQRESEKTFDDVVNHLSVEEDYIQYIALLFMHRGMEGYALKTYLRGRKLLKNEQLFIIDVADIYHKQKEYQKMIEEYTNLLERNPDEFEKVKGRLQEVVTEDEPYEIFRKFVLKKVQTSPDNTGYAELLSWLFLQRKDFNSAFVQTRALDRKLKEGGRRLVELARIATDYHDYEMADRIYQSVLDIGTDAAWYIPAKRGQLDIKYLKITQSGAYTSEDVKTLETSYSDFINKYGLERPESNEATLKLAEIEGLYDNKIKDAIELLEKFCAGNPNRQMNAKAKLALGDYYLLEGEIWEATLRYSQVEKMFANDPLGHEAKFRNAKLAFYDGEFEWANAQLDVLKGSTSELIANDALQLALVIQENTIDSNDAPLRLFASAGLMIFRNQFEVAEKKMDSISTLFPGNSLEDDILMQRAQIAMKKRDYSSAFGFYEKVYTAYGQDVLADDALYKAAQLQENYLNNSAKAKELYEKLILEYKGSVYALEARNRYRALRGDALN